MSSSPQASEPAPRRRRGSLVAMCMIVFLVWLGLHAARQPVNPVPHSAPQSVPMAEAPTAAGAQQVPAGDTTADLPAAPASRPPSPSAAAPAAAPTHHAGQLEVSLFAQPAAEPASVELSWTLQCKRGTPPVALPRTLWLVTSGCGVTDERAIVRDTGQLAPGDLLLTGSITLTGTTSVGPIAGELWTGPRSDERSVPVPNAVVHPSSAPAGHGHP